VIPTSGTDRPPARELPVRLLAPGVGAGSALVLSRALSFWGGVDPTSGVVVDRRHPQRGARVGGRVLVLPAVRGSSSSSSVLTECIRIGTAPAAILLGEPDAILAVGSLVAAELYGEEVPIGLLDPHDLGSIRDGDRVEVTPEGALLVEGQG
jgi:uncharacterized protein